MHAGNSNLYHRTFSIKGFDDWKHAIETGKALNKHAASKEHLACEAMWRDSEKRRDRKRDFHSLKFRATGSQQILHISRNLYAGVFSGESIAVTWR